MTTRIVVLLIAAALAGCADAPAETDLSTSMADADGDGFWDAVEIKYGTDPNNATDFPDVMQHVPVEFKQTVQNVVGTGVPSVQCPADAVNSRILTWTIEAPEGNVTDPHVGHFTVTIVGGTGVNDVDLFVTNPDGQTQSATGSTATETIEFPGHQPFGDYTIEVRGCSGAGNVDVDGSAMIGWTPSQDDLLAGEDTHGHDDGHGH